MSFVEETLKEINIFRQNPIGVKKKCDVLITAMTRLKGNEKFMKEVQAFVGQLSKLSSMPKLVHNEDLAKVAKAELNKFVKDAKYNRFQDSKATKALVPPQYQTENVVLIADEGADTPQDVPTKILLNLKDLNQYGRKALTNPEYTQIGIAQVDIEGENYGVLVFANSLAEEEEQVELPKGDLTHLKKAFDLFDFDKQGRIRIRLVMDSMKRMKFDETEPVLYDIMKGLTGSEVVSWPQFASHAVMRMGDRKTDKGLRDIFDLFIDNPEKDSITFETFKKIIQELKMDITDEEAKTILENSTEKGNEMSFDEFAGIMKNM